MLDATHTYNQPMLNCLIYNQPMLNCLLYNQPILSCLLYFLLGLFSSSGVAGMVLNIILHIVLSITSSYNPLSYLFYTSLSTWFSVFLSVFPGTGASNILLSTWPLLLILSHVLSDFLFIISMLTVFIVEVTPANNRQLMDPQPGAALLL